jgi:ADP-ribose pyrophosphatase YjhB (NUDIX family)
VKKALFRLCSRLLRLYKLWPVFGPVPCSAAVIREGDRFLALERNDGLGLCLPGGMKWPWESHEKALQREVAEETGLSVIGWRQVFTFRNDKFIDAEVIVYEVTATGNVRPSWEGVPRWATASEIAESSFMTGTPLAIYLLEHPSQP